LGGRGEAAVALSFVAARRSAGVIMAPHRPGGRRCGIHRGRRLGVSIAPGRRLSFREDQMGELVSVVVIVVAVAALLYAMAKL
jgi:hypothetical protein